MPLSVRKQQVKFLSIIYDNQAVFSLHDGDLGYCDELKHSIPVSSDKPVYLPHRNHSSPITIRGKKMPGYMAQTGNHKAL